MNTPTPPTKVAKEPFLAWLATVRFADHGDKLERAHAATLNAMCPNLEKFWRVFVVPLTERIRGCPRSVDFSIRCRDGIDPFLQIICGESYSVAWHLVTANKFVREWDQWSLDSVYTRLGSAMDVLEAMVARGHLLLCKCRGKESDYLKSLKRKSKYSDIESIYFAGEELPKGLRLIADRALFQEYLNSHVKVADATQTLERFNHLAKEEIRPLRNVLVHDVRIGGFEVGGKLWIRKHEKAAAYRRWDQIQAVMEDDATINNDFVEAKTLAESDLANVAEVINALYGILEADVRTEFETEERTKLREYMGLEFVEAESFAWNDCVDASFVEYNSPSQSVVRIDVPPGSAAFHSDIPGSGVNVSYSGLQYIEPPDEGDQRSVTKTTQFL